MYTHTLTINTGAYDLEAELSFDGGEHVTIKLPDETEIEGENLSCLTRMLELLAHEVTHCGGISKFEVVEK